MKRFVESLWEISESDKYPESLSLKVLNSSKICVGFLVWKINWFRIFCETMEKFYTSLDEYNNTLHIKDKYINKTQENTTKFFICLLIS